MSNVGWFLVALGFISVVMSAFIGFTVLSAMAVDLIPFDGPPKPLLYGVLGGYWLMIGGGAIIGIDYLIKSVKP